MTIAYAAILFDLDGTILDTATDLLFALNHLRHEHHLPPWPLSMMRHLVSEGAKRMLEAALEIDANHPAYQGLHERFLTIYEAHLADTTQLFPGMENILDYLENKQIPWGIVTNKRTKQTMRLLSALRLDHRPQCVVCGDTLSTCKPDAKPVLHACQLLKQIPSECLFIGDSIHDIIAGKRAGTKTLAALYGYINQQDDPALWGADGYLVTPHDIMKWLL